MTTGTHTRRAPSLSTVFDPKHNALNAIRLAMALSVIVWHSFPLTATAIGFEPLRQLFSRFAVDVFFTISGFLITSSWVRNPSWSSYLRARILRIFPAFWVCLLLTAFVFAPLSLAIGHHAVPDGLLRQQISYVIDNSLLRVWQPGVAGTPIGVPYFGQWNGALWTLMWEFGCYIAVLAFGIVGLLKRRFTIPLLYAALTVGLLATAYGPIHNFYLHNGSRFGIMFAGGALVYQYRDRIPVRGWLIGLAGVVILASTFLPDYGIIAAVPIAYLALSAGALLKQPRLSITNDLSYGVYIFGFPIQQLLSTAGAVTFPVPLYALLAITVTLPVAALSWFVIERPALRLKGRRRPAPRAGSDGSPGSGGSAGIVGAAGAAGVSADPRSTAV